MKNAEAFTCKVYRVPEDVITDQARVILFMKDVKPKLLLPTNHAVKSHIEITLTQIMVWLQATCVVPNLHVPKAGLGI